MSADLPGEKTLTWTPAKSAPKVFVSADLKTHPQMYLYLELGQLSQRKSDSATKDMMDVSCGKRDLVKSIRDLVRNIRDLVRSIRDLVRSIRDLVRSIRGLLRHLFSKYSL